MQLRILAWIDWVLKKQLSAGSKAVSFLHSQDGSKIVGDLSPVENLQYQAFQQTANKIERKPLKIERIEWTLVP